MLHKRSNPHSTLHSDLLTQVNKYFQKPQEALLLFTALRSGYVIGMTTSHGVLTWMLVSTVTIGTTLGFDTSVCTPATPKGMICRRCSTEAVVLILVCLFWVCYSGTPLTTSRTMEFTIRWRVGQLLGALSRLWLTGFKAPTNSGCPLRPSGCSQPLCVASPRAVEVPLFL